MATRCLCPPESRCPPSPTMVFHPSGSSSTKAEASATSAAPMTSLSDADGRPYRMFSMMVVGNSVMCWSTRAMEERKACRFHASNGCSHQRISPSCASANLRSKRIREVFPAPVDPTTPVVFPASNDSERCSNNMFRPGYPKPTSTIEIEERFSAPCSGTKVPCFSSIGEANTSSTRVEEAMARW